MAATALQIAVILDNAQLTEEQRIKALMQCLQNATAVRWIERNRPNFHNLILWGAAFPTDIQYQPMKDYLDNKKLYVVYGRQDEYLSDERIKTHELFTQEQGLEFEMIWFDGIHEIDRKVLMDLVERL